MQFKRPVNVTSAKGESNSTTDTYMKEKTLNRSILRKFTTNKNKKGHSCAHDVKDGNDGIKKVQLAKLYTHVDGVTVKNYLKPKYDRSQTPE